MLRRILKAILFKREVYIEVCERPETVVQAFALVLLTGIAMASGVMGVFEGDPQERMAIGNFINRLIGIWIGVVTTLLGWVLWGGITFLMGSKFLGGGASYNEVLRVLGMGYAPGILFILVSLPAVGSAVWILSSLWILVAAVVGQRAIQEFDWLSSILSSFLGWFLFVFLLIPILS